MSNQLSVCIGCRCGILTTHKLPIGKTHDHIINKVHICITCTLSLASYKKLILYNSDVKFDGLGLCYLCCKDLYSYYDIDMCPYHKNIWQHTDINDVLNNDSDDSDDNDLDDDSDDGTKKYYSSNVDEKTSGILSLILNKDMKFSTIFNFAIINKMNPSFLLDNLLIEVQKYKNTQHKSFKHKSIYFSINKEGIVSGSKINDFYENHNSVENSAS